MAPALAPAPSASSSPPFSAVSRLRDTKDVDSAAAAVATKKFFHRRTLRPHKQIYFHFHCTQTGRDIRVYMYPACMYLFADPNFFFMHFFGTERRTRTFRCRGVIRMQSVGGYIKFASLSVT